MLSWLGMRFSIEVALVLLLCCTGSLLQAKDHFYVGFSVGIQAMEDDRISLKNWLSNSIAELGTYNLIDSGRGNVVKYKLGSSIAAMLGFNLSKDVYFEIEGNAARARPRFDSGLASGGSLELASDDPDEPTLYAAHDTVMSTDVMVNMYRDLRLWGDLELVPYIGGGLGYANLYLLGSTDSGLAYHAKFGVSRRTDTATMYVEVKYFSAFAGQYDRVDFYSKGFAKEIRATVNHGYSYYGCGLGIKMHL